MIPADLWLGIESQRFSPGVREMCSRVALCGSFKRAGENLHRTAQICLSSGTVRTIVENQGRAALAAQQSGKIGPGFSAGDCRDGIIISGADGVMVPLVTEQQKRRRRKTQRARRQRESRRSTARVGRPKRGSDGPYKEFKVLSFYDPDKSHCHVLATGGNHKVLGRMMRREGGRVRINEAKVCYAVTDGAEWIARQYRRQLPMLDEHILDYYHLRDHVKQAGEALYGQDTKKAEVWREDMMECVWQRGSLAMLHKLSGYIRRHRSGPKQQALKSLAEYVGKRVAMTDYPKFRSMGYDCGSGPTESLAGVLTSRLKGAGMRWDRDNAEAMMALGSLQSSCLWNSYWKTQRNTA